MFKDTANEHTCIVASFAVFKYSLEQERPDKASNQDLTFNLRDHMSLATIIACSNEENGEAIAILLANVVPAQHDEKSSVFISPVITPFYINYICQ